MEKWKILVVDDDMDMLETTRLILKRFKYEDKGIDFIPAKSAAEAKDILSRTDDIALVLLDIVMEEDDAGSSVIHYIRKELQNQLTQIIVRTGQPGNAPEEKMILEYEINDYQEKSELTVQKLKTSIITALRSYKSLRKITHLYKELENTHYELFFILGQIAESRSPETGNHVKRVGEMCKIIAQTLGMDPEESRNLQMAATMHDIGKMAIQEHIINKPGRLTEEEYTIMKSHSLIGFEMLKDSNRNILQLAARIAKEHHENYDGSGYPVGLKGNEICLESRIVAIADVFDALGNKRVYKEPWDKDEIMEFIKEQRGKKFDPSIIDLIFENIDEFFKVRELYPD